MTCGKSVRVRVEYSIAEEKEDTLGWEANRNLILACRVLELQQVLDKTNSAAKTVTLPFHI